MAKTIKIDITSDTICPWCYIGYKRLSKAITMLKDKEPETSVELEWHPFYLNPDIDRSLPKKDYYRSKFGEERTQKMFPFLSTIGKEVGIYFSFNGKLGPTRDSHRLAEYAKSKDLQTPAVLAMFKAYFEQDQDISDKSVLAEIAQQVGLEKQEAAHVLDSDEFGRTVDKEVEKAYQNRIEGVPHFLINEVEQISGGQEPEAFLKVLQRA